MIIILSLLFAGCVCESRFSRVQPSAAPWSVASLVPLSMGILQARILEWVPISSSNAGYID